MTNMFISDYEFYDNEDPFILDDEEYIGIVLHLEDEDGHLRKVCVLVENVRLCGEDFGYDYEIIALDPFHTKKLKNIDDLYGMKIQNIEYDVNQKWRQRDSDGSSLSISLFLEKYELVLAIYNWHNGYYPHSYHVEYLGKKDNGTL